MPIDPRSDLPVRIAQAYSEILGFKVILGPLYGLDGGDFNVWKSEPDETNDFPHKNRRICCSDLHYQIPENAQNSPLQNAFQGKSNTHIFARLQVHQVHKSREDLTGRTDFKPNKNTYWVNIAGITLEFCTIDPSKISPENPKGLTFSELDGRRAQFGNLDYRPDLGGMLISFAEQKLKEVFRPDQHPQPDILTLT